MHSACMCQGMCWVWHNIDYITSHNMHDKVKYKWSVLECSHSLNHFHDLDFNTISISRILFPSFLKVSFITPEIFTAKTTVECQFGQNTPQIWDFGLDKRPPHKGPSGIWVVECIIRGPVPLHLGGHHEEHQTSDPDSSWVLWQHHSFNLNRIELLDLHSLNLYEGGGGPLAQQVLNHRLFRLFHLFNLASAFFSVNTYKQGGNHSWKFAIYDIVVLWNEMSLCHW